MTEPSSQLSAAADRLTGLTDAEYQALLARSARQFADGEGQPEPLRAYRWDGPPTDPVPGLSAEAGGS